MRSGRRRARADGSAISFTRSLASQRISTHEQRTVACANSSPAYEMTRASLSLRQFWRQRNLETHLWLDRHTANNVSIFIAYGAYKSNLTANQLSIASGVFSAFALMVAAFSDATDLFWPVLTIYGLAQISYLLDCADGQLARVTNTTSTYGAFLDKAIDLASIKLQSGAFFIFLYRHYVATGTSDEAQIWLFSGLAFIFVKVARFVVSELFSGLMPQIYEDSKIQPTQVTEILKVVMDTQISLLNMLVVLISPLACLLIYLVQFILLGGAWIRYFWRGRR